LGMSQVLVSLPAEVHALATTPATGAIRASSLSDFG
jgi:hypothetical protein